MQNTLLGAEADVVEAAFHYVLYCDVVSKPHKREMMAKLASIRRTLDCEGQSCTGCLRRRACETRVLDIMASPA